MKKIMYFYDMIEVIIRLHNDLCVVNLENNKARGIYTYDNEDYAKLQGISSKDEEEIISEVERRVEVI